MTAKTATSQQITRVGMERGLKSVLSSHLSYEQGESHGRFLPNSRNGSYPKTVSTIAGDIDLKIPRGRDGTFAPTLVLQGPRHPVAWMR